MYAHNLSKYYRYHISNSKIYVLKTIKMQFFTFINENSVDACVNQMVHQLTIKTLNNHLVNK